MKINSIKFLLIFFAFTAFVACKTTKKESELLKLGIHTVVVQKVINTSQYTYFLLSEVGNPKVKESDTMWAAVPFMESKIGDTLYYKGAGYPMKNFQSKELNRTFPDVLFLDALTKNADFVKKDMANVPAHQAMSSTDTATAGKPQIAKIDVKVDKAAGGITIAELYAKKESYNGKIVKIKGKVTKFSPDIMEKNWIHLQDGTDASGKYDLTITTTQTVVVGDIITVEGKIAINKDLGYSYFYEVIMEEAKINK